MLRSLISNSYVSGVLSSLISNSYVSGLDLNSIMAGPLPKLDDILAMTCKLVEEQKVEFFFNHIFQ